MARVADDHANLQQMARRHLWLHFSRLAAFAEHDIPVFVRGDGVHLFDDTGKRYLDGLSGLFAVQIGHGRSELAEAAARRPSARVLPHLDLRPSRGHRARGAARRPGARRSEPCVLHHRRIRGGRVRMEARTCLLQGDRPAQPHEGDRRALAYHGTTMGALSITGLPAHQDPVRALGARRACTSPTPTGSVAVPARRSRRTTTVLADAAPTRSSRPSSQKGPRPFAAVYLEPVQNAGGCFPPPPGYFARVREVCDRYGVLLVSDEVICGFGRLGATVRRPSATATLPDMITFAKGITSGYAPLGGVICATRSPNRSLRGLPALRTASRSPAIPSAAQPRSRTSTSSSAKDILEHVQANEAGTSARRMDSLRDLAIVGDVRGDGYFLAVELVKDPNDQACVHACTSASGSCAALVAPLVRVGAHLPGRRPRATRSCNSRRP